MSSRFKRFIRNNSPLFSVMLLLTVINVLTSSYPWALYPIAAMAIPVFISAANIFFAEDNAEQADQERVGDQSRDARRQARLERKLDKLERKYGPLQTNAPVDEPASLATTSKAPTETRLDDGVAAQLAEAKRYKDQMTALMKGSQDKHKLSRLSELSGQVDEWMTSIQQMADRISAFKRNSAVQNDRATVERAIEKLQTQWSSETDERVKQQLERTLNARKQQRDSLSKLESVMRQAEIQLESTVAALGTIYSQALATQSTNQVADYSHLSAEVNEQVHSLHDQLEALEEVKLGNLSNAS